MRNRGKIRTEIRRMLNDEKLPYKWNDAILDDRINLWHKKVVKTTDILIAIESYSTIQYQSKYALPSDFLSISKKWQVSFDGKKIEPLDIEREDVASPTWRTRVASTPTDYYIDETHQYLVLTPPPASAADTDTVQDVGGISDTDTTITLSSTSDFDQKGAIIIDDEVIHYGYKSSTQLLLCERGMEGTTAASHANGATITKRDILLYYNYEPSDLNNDSDVPFNGINAYESYHLSIVHAVVSMCLGTIPEKIELSMSQYGFYEREEKKMEFEAAHPKHNPQRFKVDPRYLIR